MKRFVAITFLILMLTMSVLAGGTYLVAKLYIDPTLKHLNNAVTAMQPEVQKKMLIHLVQLQELRKMGSIYVPALFFLTGITATFILALLLRGTVRRSSLIYTERPKEVKGEVSAGQEKVPESDMASPTEVGACRILFLLQNKGRLIDFLQEDITRYPDAQIGAAIRYIHEDCSNALREYMSFAPVMSQKEGENVVVSEGFDPSEIRLTGNITGAPPFKGILRHAGWKVSQINLPDLPKGQKQKHTIIAPAEVEIGQTE
jgi:hypothetical protein